MQATGIIKRIDDLGRVMIPKNVRKMLRLKIGDPLEVYVDKNNMELIFKKYCAYSTTQEDQYKKLVQILYKATGLKIIFTDREKVIWAYDKHLIGETSDNFSNFIPCNYPDSRKYICEINNKSFSGYWYPIVFDNDICFNIIATLDDDDEITKHHNEMIKMTVSAIQVLQADE